MTAAVVRGDALRIPLADESVDLIVTSPPYFALRSYRDEGEHYHGQLGSEATPQAFLEALWAVTAEMWRVLKPTGSVWVNLGDKYAGSGGHNNAGISRNASVRWCSVCERNVSRTACQRCGNTNLLLTDERLTSTRRNAPDRYTQETGGVLAKSLLGLPWRYAIGCIDGKAAPNDQRWILRAEVVWSKPNGLPESVTDRVRRSHEQWFHLVKSPRYFSAVDEVREAHSDRRDLNGATDRADYQWNRDESGTARQWEPSGERVYNHLGKLPGSVWTIPSEPLLIPEAVAKHYDLPDHFAAFPQEWPRRIILGWSPSGICVECGEGRRPVVAKDYDRRATHSKTATNKTEQRAAGELDGKSFVGPFMGAVEATITDYACACSLYDSPGEEFSCSETFSAQRAPLAPDSSSATPFGTPSCAGDLTGTLPPTRPAVILDPFGGTGTTAMVARTLGRFGISLDLSADYCRLSRWRIFSSGHGEKTMQRTHRENQGVIAL